MAPKQQSEPRVFEDMISQFETEIKRRGQALAQEMQRSNVQSQDLQELSKQYEFVLEKMRELLNVEKSIAQHKAQSEQEAGFDFESARQELLEKISRRLS